MQQDSICSSNSKSDSSALKFNANVSLNFSSSHRTHLPPTIPLAFANANGNSSSPSTTSSSSSIFIRNDASAGNGILGGSHLDKNHHQHHRRAHSEISFRLPEDLTDLSPSNPFNGGGSSTASLEELGSEDDLFSTYIDVDKLGGGDGSATGSGGGANGSPDQSGNGNPNNIVEGDKSSDLVPKTSSNARPRHRHSCSVDGSITNSMIGEIMEAKKAMPPDKLAELWTIDPKRAKRILANRQSAARSKERKVRYIQELERRVQILQTEATTLSAQLTLFQRDTTGLSNENAELKLRLQAMEQQAHLRDSLNETLKKEVERLKAATGELTSPSESFNLGMHQIPFTAANFFSLPPHAQAHGQETMQTPPFNHSQSSMSTYQTHQPSSHSLTDVLQNDQIGRLKGLDINSKGSALVKSETPSLSASESGTTSSAQLVSC